MQLEAVVSKIEDKLINIGDQEVSSQVIGELAMQELVDLSEVAYVRFASVYRRFTDISGFESELADIRSKKNLR
jgi:transcriptional repressor NrdR